VVGTEMHDPLQRLARLGVIEPVVAPPGFPPLGGGRDDGTADGDQIGELSHRPPSTVEVAIGVAIDSEDGSVQGGVDGGDGFGGPVEPRPVPEDTGEGRHVPLKTIPQLRHCQLAFFTAVIAR
jgi:hypothetical protein